MLHAICLPLFASCLYTIYCLDTQDIPCTSLCAWWSNFRQQYSNITNNLWKLGIYWKPVQPPVLVAWQRALLVASWITSVFACRDWASIPFHKTSRPKSDWEDLGPSAIHGLQCSYCAAIVCVEGAKKPGTFFPCLTILTIIMQGNESIFETWWIL